VKNTVKVVPYSIVVFGAGLFIGQHLQSKFTKKRVMKSIPSIVNMLDNLFDLALEEGVTKTDLQKHAVANIGIITDAFKLSKEF
jgi:hypothetical protein